MALRNDHKDVCPLHLPEFLIEWERNAGEVKNVVEYFSQAVVVKLLIM